MLELNGWHKAVDVSEGILKRGIFEMAVQKPMTHFVIEPGPEDSLVCEFLKLEFVYYGHVFGFDPLFEYSNYH